MRIRLLAVLAALPGILAGSPAAAAGPVQPGIIDGRTSTAPPWIAAVFADGGFGCGGTLVSAEYVLTAAHCLRSGTTMSVRVGSPTYDSGGVTRTVTARVTRHDLALLRLAAPVETTYVTLAEADPPIGAIDSIYGWGRTCASGCGFADRLRVATVQVTSTREQDAAGAEGILSTGVTGTAWIGDSGGPQLHAGTQVGVGSLADGRQQIYASVADNRSWIGAVTGA